MYVVLVVEFKVRVLKSATLVFVLTLLMVSSPPGYSTAAAQAAPPLDFKLIYRAAQLALHAYDSKSDIQVRYGTRTTRVATPGRTNVQYILLHDHRRRMQIIAVRGTVDDTNWKLDRDRRIVRDGRAGVMLHRGFRRAADTIFEDVKPWLKPGYTTYLTGHSLGGAVAAILGIYLWDGDFRLGGIYTFGQPKFTNLQGARAYSDLPILRVVYQNDTVALLPNRTRGDKQQFVHIGPVLNLLAGPHYLYGSAKQATRFSKRSFRRMLFQISLPDHKMKWYLQNLRDKQAGSKRVRFRDRNRYIKRHKYGSGVDTAPPKRRYNFNHHN